MYRRGEARPGEAFDSLRRAASAAWVAQRYDDLAFGVLTQNRKPLMHREALHARLGGKLRIYDKAVARDFLPHGSHDAKHRKDLPSQAASAKNHDLNWGCPV